MTNEAQVEALVQARDAELEAVHSDFAEFIERTRAREKEQDVALADALRRVDEAKTALRDLRYQFSHGMYLSTRRRLEAEAFVDEVLARLDAAVPASQPVQE